MNLKIIMLSRKKRPNKDYTLSDSIYTKFKNREHLTVEMEDGSPITGDFSRRKERWCWKEVQGSLLVASNLLLPDWVLVV